MYQQQKDNKENKRYNCSCGAAFATLKEFNKHNQYFTIRSLVVIRKSKPPTTSASKPSFFIQIQ